MTVLKDEKRRTWTVVTYIDGKQHWRRGFKTKREAVAYEHQIKEAGSEMLPAKFDRFGEVANEFFLHQQLTCSKSTYVTNMSRYKVHIEPYLAKAKMEKIRTADVQSIVHRLVSSPKGYSNAYINNIISTINKIFNFAINMDYFRGSNPAKRIRLLKVEKAETKYFTLAEIETLLEAEKDEEYRNFLTVLAFCGIRVGEARAIQWRQVDLQAGTILIDSHIMDKGRGGIVPGRKNNKNYTIYMTSRVKFVLEKMYKSESQKDGFSTERYVFGFWEPWSYNKVRTRFKKLLVSSGIGREDATLHYFRHSYASILANSGATIQELAAALGDTLEITINTYSHMYHDTNKKVSQRLDIILNKRYDL